MSQGASTATLALTLLGLVYSIGAVSDFCSLKCVKRIYDKHCGGAVCITGVTSASQYNGLCSSGCLDAISSPEMLTCIQRLDGGRKQGAPPPGNFLQVQESVISEVIAFCDKGSPFGDEVAGPPATTKSTIATATASFVPSLLVESPKEAPAPQPSLEEDDDDAKEMIEAMAPSSMEEGEAPDSDFSGEESGEEGVLDLEEPLVQLSEAMKDEELDLAEAESMQPSAAPAPAPASDTDFGSTDSGSRGRKSRKTL